MEESIREALRSGDVKAARQLVVSQEWQDLSEDTLANLLWHAANYAAHAHQHDDIKARIRFVRLLLAPSSAWLLEVLPTRGAEPRDQLSTIRQSRVPATT